MLYSVKTQCDPDCTAASHKGPTQDCAYQLSITDNGGDHRALILYDKLLVTDGL